MRSLLLVPAFALTFMGLLWPGPAVSAAQKEDKTRRAKVRVLLPDGAKLTINGNAPKKSTSRRFITRPLETGKTYHYTFKAEFTRGNLTVTVARKVALRAGQNKVVSLRLPGTSARETTYGGSRRSANRGAVRTYRLRVDHPIDPAFGSKSYRDMTADEDSVRD